MKRGKLIASSHRGFELLSGRSHSKKLSGWVVLIKLVLLADCRPILCELRRSVSHHCVLEVVLVISGLD